MENSAFQSDDDSSAYKDAYQNECSPEFSLTRHAASSNSHTMELADALAQYPKFAAIRDAAFQTAKTGVWLCELEGTELGPLMPDSIQHWPAWYLRLPMEWIDDVPYMLNGEGLYSYLTRDALNPWYIAQFICLPGRPLEQGVWPEIYRRVEIYDKYVWESIEEAYSCNALFVLIECAQNLFIAEIPIGEYFIDTLQCGQNASSRNPLFDMPLAEVQALARKLEDTNFLYKDENVLHPEFLGRKRTSNSSNDKISEPFCSKYRKGFIDKLGTLKIGSLDAVVNYFPNATTCDNSLVLKIEIQDENFYRYILQPEVEVGVTHLYHDAQIDVVLSVDNVMLVISLPMDDVKCVEACKQLATEKRCKVVIENYYTGRWKIIEIDWPVDICTQSGFVASIANRRVAADSLKKYFMHAALEKYIQGCASELDRVIKSTRFILDEPDDFDA